MVQIMIHSIQIAGRRIESQHPCFIIAEAGVNHGGNVDLAKQLIDAAVAAGADAVKFQTFHAESVVTCTAEKAEYQKSTTSPTESQYDMIKSLELPDDIFWELSEYADIEMILQHLRITGKKINWDLLNEYFSLFNLKKKFNEFKKKFRYKN